MGQHLQLFAQSVFLQAAAAHPVPCDRELRSGPASRRGSGPRARGGTGIGRGRLGASQTLHEAAAPGSRDSVPETSVPFFCGGCQARQNELRQRARRHGCAWPSAASQVGGAGDGWHPHAADGGRRAAQLCCVVGWSGAGESELHSLCGGAALVHRAVQHSHGDHVESFSRTDQTRRASGDDFPGGRCQVDWHRQQASRRPGRDAVAACPAGKVSRQQTQGGDGRPGHGHFLEWQHRHAEGRDAFALQCRLKHPADWPGLRAGSE